MAEKLSPWCKKAKIAMIQKDIGVSDMAERLGNNRSYISSGGDVLPKVKIESWKVVYPICGDALGI